MGVVFLGSYLCISILEFKFGTKTEKSSSLSSIYVFLYQNLNADMKKLADLKEQFMYFYIRI